MGARDRADGPPPGQLRIDVDATRLRSFSAHPHAAHLEGILQQATELDAAARPDMEYFARELAAWLEPTAKRSEPPDVDEISRRLTAISASAIANAQQRRDLDLEAGVISPRLRAAHEDLEPVMAQLGKVIYADEGMTYHGLGGKSHQRHHGCLDGVACGRSAISASPGQSHARHCLAALQRT